jgi:hypothetical protein
MAQALEAGMVWVNSENVRHLPTPFGGMKASGIGRDGGDYSFDFYMETKNIAHKIDTLTLEYGTLVPMRYMNGTARSRWCLSRRGATGTSFEDSRRFGAAVREAIEASGRHRGGASPAARCRTASTTTAARGIDAPDQPRVLPPGRSPRGRALAAAATGRVPRDAPRVREKCLGEGHMHDTAMLLGLARLGRYYAGRCEIITDYFPSSGTGQINAEFHL